MEFSFHREKNKKKEKNANKLISSFQRGINEMKQIRQENALKDDIGLTLSGGQGRPDEEEAMSLNI